MNRIVRTLVFPQPVVRLAALLAAVVLQPALAQEMAISEVAVDPPGRVARLSYVEGAVSFASADTGDWTDAVLNRPLTSGDRLWLDQDARAELEVGSTTLHLDRDTAFGFVRLDDSVLLTSLTEGAASIRVRTLADQETIQVETPNAAVRILRAGEYHIAVDTDSDQTIVKTRSGEAEVMGGSASHLVRASQEGVFTGLEELRVQIGPIAPRTAFETWADDRARREDASVSSRYVSSEVIGYEDLDDHGDWLYESTYGHVWRPHYLAHDWAPYRFGRWAWISPWGWTWIDDARWGFAPFHYGRWVSLRNRWCWVPGPRHVRPLYAPALVGWTGNPPGSFSAVGYPVRWFPLAPHEVYVPSYKHTPRHARRVNQSNTVIDDAKMTRAYAARYHARDATSRWRVAERELDAPRAAGQSNAPQSSAEPMRPAPPTARPPASYSPAAPSRQGAAAPAPQSSRREAGDASPARPSQPQPRDTGRPRYQQP